MTATTGTTLRRTTDHRAARPQSWTWLQPTGLATAVLCAAAVGPLIAGCDGSASDPSGATSAARTPVSRDLNAYLPTAADFPPDYKVSRPPLVGGDILDDSADPGARCSPSRAVPAAQAQVVAIGRWSITSTLARGEVDFDLLNAMFTSCSQVVPGDNSQPAEFRLTPRPFTASGGSRVQFVEVQAPEVGSTDGGEAFVLFIQARDLAATVTVTSESNVNYEAVAPTVGSIYRGILRRLGS